MRKPKPSKKQIADSDTLRSEYDFRAARRGVTSARYAQGANVVVVDPDLRDVFPDGPAVNEALRALAPLLREQQGASKRPAKVSSRLRPRSGPDPTAVTGSRTRG